MISQAKNGFVAEMSLKRQKVNKNSGRNGFDYRDRTVMFNNIQEVKMRKTMIFILVTSLLFGSCQKKAATNTGEIEAKIQSAKDYLLSGERPGKDAKKGFRLLVEAIEMASSEAEFPDSLGKKISEARRLFELNSIFDQKGIALLKESYLMANDGVEFQMPETISSIQQAVEYARQLIGSSQRHLKQGKNDAGVKDLLEVALMVVTPMKKSH